jgi:predicted DNA-binding transcriptional regulator AlpA
MTTQIISPKQLPKETGLSKTTIWRLERAGQFPRRIKLSAGRVGYRASEVAAWLESRQAA